MASEATSYPYQCATCERADVRLYRIYGNFLRAAEIFCNAHVPSSDRGWWVPLIVAPDGSVWGYTSAPAQDIARWQALPDAQMAGPVWQSGRWKESDDGE